MILDKLVDELCRLSRYALFSLVPLTAAFIVTGYFSGSLTIASVAMDSGFSIIVQLFAYKSIRAMRSADPIRFPHGTGKLENFSGFLYGALNIPVGAFILYRSIAHLMEPTAVSFTIAQLPMLPSLIRSLYLFRFARRLSRSFHSPLVDSYVADFRVSVWFDGLVILAMGIGMALDAAGLATDANYLDPAFSLGVSLYMLRVAAGQLVKNFHVLIDMPVPEHEQLAIIRVLASEFEAYEQIGAIRTRQSGAQRFVEVELYFAGHIDVSAIAALTARMQEKLDKPLKNVKLSIAVRELVAAAGSETREVGSSSP